MQYFQTRLLFNLGLPGGFWRINNGVVQFADRRFGVWFNAWPDCRYKTPEDIHLAVLARVLIPVRFP